MNHHIGRPKLKFLTAHHLEHLPHLEKLAAEDRRAMQVVAHVLPFRVNGYVVEELIDWDSLLRLLERIVAAGKHLAIMAHFNHWSELETPAVERAIRRLLTLGAVIRTQSPLVHRINDNADVWARMWQRQVRLGCPSA